MPSQGKTRSGSHGRIRKGINPEHPWDRQPGEGARPFEMFQAYLRMGATTSDRSRPELATQLGVSYWNLAKIAQKNNWSERVQAYDEHMERTYREDMERLRREQIKRLVEKWGDGLFDHLDKQMRISTAFMDTCLAALAPRKDPEGNEVPGMIPADMGEVARLAETSRKIVQDIREIMEFRPRDSGEPKRPLPPEVAKGALQGGDMAREALESEGKFPGLENRMNGHANGNGNGNGHH